MSDNVIVIANKQDIVDIADAVRIKNGTTGEMTFSGIVSGVSVDAMPHITQATPNISASSAGLITATATQEAGYVEAGTKSATKQLTTKGATTITPTSSVQTAVAAETYCTGDIKVAASTGKQVYTGTIAIGSSYYGNGSLTINTGVAVQSSAIFIVLPYESANTMPISSEPSVAAARFSETDAYVIWADPENVQDAYDLGYVDVIIPKKYDCNFTISDSTVKVTGNANFINPTYKWILIQ